MLGKLIGGIAGLAMGGPLGAVVGAALGHAADNSAIPGLQSMGGKGFGALPFAPARLAAMLGSRDQVFAINVVVLSAKLAKCDGPVNRAEIDAFKRQFRMPAGQSAQIGRLFDQARDSTDPFEPYATQLGGLFADAPAMLEDVLTALFAIARADGRLTAAEQDFLIRTHRGFGLDRLGWDRARGATPRHRTSDEPDPYQMLGLARSASDDDLRATWKRLMRENHPDSMASRGVAPEVIAQASDRVARINAAWDRIKRERGL